MFPGTRIEDCATENTCNVNIGKIHSEVVNPYDEWVTEQTEGESLTLFTCAEHGTKRFVVKCEPVGNTDQQNGEKLDRREGGVYH